MVSQKTTNNRRKKIDEKRLKLFQELWEDDLEKIPTWNRLKHKGYASIPRSMPYINQILDSMADKGKPVSNTYASLWFRDFDDSFIEIHNEKSLAYESGFSGERATTTWRARMNSLIELGFIAVKPGNKSDFQYVIVLNPYPIIFNYFQTREKNKLYNSLVERMVEIGATWDV